MTDAALDAGLALLAMALVVVVLFLLVALFERLASVDVEDLEDE